jgi:DNA-binding response OmpR family regulator
MFKKNEPMKKIAIIEDDKVTQYLLSSLLVKEGFKVKSIIDGNEILENEKVLISDLIILDIMLPNIYDTTKLVKLYENLNIPIIVISSMDKYDGIYFTKRINGESYFSKPFDYRVIIKEVKDLLKPIN